MRKKIHSTTRVNYISILILLFILLLSNIAVGQGKQFEIIITNLSNEEIDEIYEGEHFKVSVMDPESEEPTPFLIDVEIEFNDELYQIDETRELILQAPDVDQDTNLVITASKDGYETNNKTITIFNNESEQPKLFIETEFDTVDAGKKFRVTVKENDQNGKEVYGALVAIQSYGDINDKIFTDDTGRAWLTAPEDKESITIIAQKDGYIDGEREIKVNIEPPWWIELVSSRYFPIIIAVIFLLLAIIYVNQRQKKSIYARAKEISNEKNIKKQDTNDKTSSPSADENRKKLDEHHSSIEETVRTQQQKDAKVEEIRISKTRKEKEIIPVKSEEDHTEKVISRKKIQKKDYDWFEGTDDIRYEIDKLTGKVDEKGIDKWYEGVESLRDKIDEKVKKKDKKKDKEKID